MADFKYIVRIAETDLDGNRPVLYALQGIKGIGYRVAEGIVRYAGIDPRAKLGSLSDEDIEKLRALIEDKIEEVIPPWMRNHRKEYVSGEDKHMLSTDLDLQVQEDINRLKRIRAYRGIRHERGLPVRGQRTRSNGRKGLAVGVSRKKK